jgi:hypothetical protein
MTRSMMRVCEMMLVIGALQQWWTMVDDPEGTGLLRGCMSDGSDDGRLCCWLVQKAPVLGPILLDPVQTSQTSSPTHPARARSLLPLR